MPGRCEHQRNARPQLEIRVGGLRLTIERIPAWLWALLAAVTSSGAAWWTTR
jgi:hypothetical protein